MSSLKALVDAKESYETKSKEYCFYLCSVTMIMNA